MYRWMAENGLHCTTSHCPKSLTSLTGNDIITLSIHCFQISLMVGKYIFCTEISILITNKSKHHVLNPPYMFSVTIAIKAFHSLFYELLRYM